MPGSRILEKEGKLKRQEKAKTIKTERNGRKQEH